MNNEFKKSLKKFAEPVKNGSIKSITLTCGDAEVKIDKAKADAIFNSAINNSPHLGEYINKQRKDYMERLGGNSKQHLKQIVENVINLEERKRQINEDIKDIFKESKSAGFDNKIIRKLIRAAKNPAKFKEELEMLEIYSDDAQLNLF